MAKTLYKPLAINWGIYLDELHNHGFTDDFAVIHFTGDTKTYQVKLYTSDDGRLYIKTWGDIHYIDDFKDISKIKIKRV